MPPPPPPSVQWLPAWLQLMQNGDESEGRREGWWGGGVEVGTRGKWEEEEGGEREKV